MLVVEVDIENELKLRETHIHDSIFKREVNKEGKFGDLVQGNKFTDDEIKEAMEKRMGCNIAAVAELSKSPGNLHISFHSKEQTLLRVGKRIATANSAEF